MDTELKTVLGEIGDSVKNFGSRLNAMQTQVDAIDLATKERHGGGFVGYGGEDLLAKALTESAELSRLREIGKGKATVKLDTKTIISSGAVGSGTAGVIAPERVGGIVPLAQRRLFLRDLLSRGNHVTGNTAYFIQETAFTNAASPQVETFAKAESADTFNTVSRPVITLAHWIPASRQVMDDVPALLAFVRNKLLYGLRYKEELEILSGDGTGQHLTGLITQATAYNTSLSAVGDTRIDTLRRALQQVEQSDEIPAGFFVLNPADWASIELTKTEEGGGNRGRYIVGDPGASNGGQPTLWGKPVVPTNAISVGTFLVGSSEGAELFDRMDATLEISTEYADYFVRNLIAILCECREVLAIYRPHSFITGTLSITSP